AFDEERREAEEAVEPDAQRAVEVGLDVEREVAEIVAGEGGGVGRGFGLGHGEGDGPAAAAAAGRPAQRERTAPRADERRGFGRDGDGGGVHQAVPETAAVRAAKAGRVRLANRTSASISGTSISTPTTVASTAPLVTPNSTMATATAISKKLLAPIKPAGAATRCGTRQRYAHP